MDIKDIFKKKNKLSMLTCYDYSFARILNESSVDVILVGDSLANVLLGLSSTKSVSLDEMLNHTAAVCRGAPDKLVVADMPYVGTQKKACDPLEVSRQFIKAGADAVKVEWFRGCKKIIAQLIKNNIPVMGHIGLTPQTVHLLGGYKLQGRGWRSRGKLIKQAKELENLGVFSLVLECVQKEAAKEITDALNLPTIGIGSGGGCDGQVLVLYDLLGLYPAKMKFARAFDQLSIRVKDAANSFDQEVKRGNFPTDSESF